MSNKAAPSWLASLLIGAILAIASGGLGAIHRHADHPPSHEHTCNHDHGHHHQEDSGEHKNKPTPDHDHEDCELCFELMVGGQWAISLDEPRQLTTTVDSRVLAVFSIVREVELSRAAMPRGPPAAAI